MSQHITIKLDQFNNIYDNRETASLDDLLQAIIFGKVVSETFSKKVSKMKDNINKFNDKDVASIYGKQTTIFDYGVENTYNVTSEEIEIYEFDDEEILKLKNALNEKYFNISINKTLITNEMKKGKCDAAIANLVKVKKSSNIRIRKKA